jgi:glycosyltransferase involved in cell wall biosynthesis
MSKKISILITTKNRLADLKITLANLNHLLNDANIECMVYDDASTDGTFDYLKANFPNIVLFRNNKSLGLIHNRNVLLNRCTGDYAISLDDDAHFLSENVLENIESYFKSHPKCGVIACRIFWGKTIPTNLNTQEKSKRVRGFVGCGHVWNLQAWRDIPNYPEWFVFYGEEEFASYQLFKKDWEVHYVPNLLVHHRVEIKARKKDSDYAQRLRRSFRSGWYLYLLFYPITMIPKKMAYTLWIQIKTKVFKGDARATLALLLAMMDVLIHLPKLFRESNRLTKSEFKKYLKLEPTKIYWQPENDT